jgi:hypothetical protein
MRTLALCLLLAACTPAPVPTAEQVSLTFTFEAGACVFCTGIDDCPLACSGEIGLTLVDADSGEVVDRVCQEFVGQDGMFLRRLPELLRDTAFDDGIMAGRRVELEVAVFSPRSREGGCPRVLAGQPPMTAGGELPTYFVRSLAPATIGDGLVDLDVVMGCVLDQPDCSVVAGDGSITAKVRDLATAQEPPATFRELDVRASHLLARPDDRFVLRIDTALTLQERTGRTPVWTATVEDPVFDQACLGTLVTRIGAGRIYPVLSCIGQLTVDELTGAVRVTTEGEYVDAAVIDDVLAGLELEAVPATGMILGRVTLGGLPVSDAVVQPLMGTAQIIYLDDTLSPTTDSATTASGWFVIVAPPALDGDGVFGETFQANVGPVVGCSRGPLGMVDGAIMAAPIELTDDCDIQP